MIISWRMHVLALWTLVLQIVSGFVPTNNPAHSTVRSLDWPPKTCDGSTRLSTCLFASLKPAALPMMDSGKALARSGELLVDLTSTLGLYGGALSAAGAQIRNSGDCVAQAAASCRFKTGVELVCDELREGATCLSEATGKLRQAVEEAEVDKDENLAKELATAAIHVDTCATNMEYAGAAIMQRKTITEVGATLVKCGDGMKQLATSIEALAPSCKEAQESSQRMAFAAERMVVAGTELQGTTEKPKKGKSWLKG